MTKKHDDFPTATAAQSTNGASAPVASPALSPDQETTALPEDWLEQVEAEEQEAPKRTDELLDLEGFRADTDEDPLDSLAAPRILKRIALRKPGKREFVRVHPDPAYTMVVVTLEYESPETRATFLVYGKALRDEMVADFGAKKQRIYLAMDWHQRLFLWPVGCPQRDGTVSSWITSAEDCVLEARQQWVRVVSAMVHQEYVCRPAKADKLPEPTWPHEDFRTLARLAFRDKTLQEGDAIVRKLREGA